mmetsp:Transcript_9860/g.21299  ORF Transcript_9860/g.21299 Transcript_9860/m.21299 type:complete len:525 (+) Transcript_9860:188-1762(+)
MRSSPFVRQSTALLLLLALLLASAASAADTTADTATSSLRGTAAAQSRTLKKSQLPSTTTTSPPATTTACRLNPTQQSLGCCCLSNKPVCNVPRCNAARTGTVLSSNRDPNFGSYTVVTLDTTAAGGAGSAGSVVDKTVVQGGHVGAAVGSYGNLGDSDDVGGTIVGVNAPPPSLNTQPATTSSGGLPGVGAEINRIPEDEQPQPQEQQPQPQEQDVAAATATATPAAPAQDQQQQQQEEQGQAQEKDTLEVTYTGSESEQPVPQDGATASSASNAADAAAEVTVQVLPPPQEAAAAAATQGTPAAPALSTSSNPNSNPNTLCTIPSFDLSTGNGNPAGYECNHDTDCQEGCCAQLGIRTVCLAPDVVAKFGNGGNGGGGGLRCRGEPNDCVEINRVRLGLAAAAGLPVDGSGGENTASTTMSAAQAVAGYATSAATTTTTSGTTTTTTTNPQDTTTTTNNDNSKPLDIKIPSIGKPFSRPCQSSSSCQSGMCAVAPNVSGGVCVDSVPGGWRLREEDFGKPNK